MNNIYQLAILMCFIISSCCQPCNDPALILPKTDGVCNIQLHWEVSTAVHHSNGTMTSSISIVPDPNVPLSQNYSDSTHTTVYVSATDTTCGIKCIEILGGFGYTCMSEGMGLAIDGKIENEKECSPLTKCAFKTMRIQTSDLEQYLSCYAPKVFKSGGFGLTAIVENTNGQRDTSFYTVQFN